MRTAQFAACLTLVAQYLLGLVVNLFVNIPSNHPGDQAYEYFGGIIVGVLWAIARGPLVLAAHVLLGLLLILEATVVTIIALRCRQRSLVVANAIGGLAILGAGFNGAAS